MPLRWTAPDGGYALQLIINGETIDRLFPNLRVGVSFTGDGRVFRGNLEQLSIIAPGQVSYSMPAAQTYFHYREMTKLYRGPTGDGQDRAAVDEYLRLHSEEMGRLEHVPSLARYKNQLLTRKLPTWFLRRDDYNQCPRLQDADGCILVQNASPSGDEEEDEVFLHRGVAFEIIQEELREGVFIERTDIHSESGVRGLINTHLNERCSCRYLISENSHLRCLSGRPSTAGAPQRAAAPSPPRPPAPAEETEQLSTPPVFVSHLAARTSGTARSSASRGSKSAADALICASEVCAEVNAISRQAVENDQKQLEGLRQSQQGIDKTRIMLERSSERIMKALTPLIEKAAAEASCGDNSCSVSQRLFADEEDELTCEEDELTYETVQEHTRATKRGHTEVDGGLPGTPVRKKQASTRRTLAKPANPGSASTGKAGLGKKTPKSSTAKKPPLGKKTPKSSAAKMTKADKQAARERAKEAMTPDASAKEEMTPDHPTPSRSSSRIRARSSR